MHYANDTKRRFFVRTFLPINIIVIVLALLPVISQNYIVSNYNVLLSHNVKIEMAVKDADSDLIAVHRAMKDVALARSNEDLTLALADVNKYDNSLRGHFLFILENDKLVTFSVV